MTDCVIVWIFDTFLVLKILTFKPILHAKEASCNKIHILSAYLNFFCFLDTSSLRGLKEGWPGGAAVPMLPHVTFAL